MANYRNLRKYIIVSLLFCIPVIIIYFLLPSGKTFRTFEIECNDYYSEISLEKEKENLYFIKAKNYKNKKFAFNTEWKLAHPVFHFECGDINNDNNDDILVGVIKASRFDTVIRKRIFIFKMTEGYIRPLWMGSRVSQPLENFRFVNSENYNLIRTIEKEKNGTFLVAEYRWKGFGLYFERYLERNLRRNRAYKLLKN